MSTAAKVVAAVVAFFVAIALVFLIGVYGFGWLSRSTADYRGNTSEINKVRANGDYRIQAYEHFYNLCAAVQTREQSITNIETQLRDKSLSSSRKEELQGALLANQNERADLINQYNADARKADTQAHFLASDLPYQIDPSNKETSCTR